MFFKLNLHEFDMALVNIYYDIVIFFYFKKVFIILKIFDTIEFS